jgi:hypothetical protein
MHATSRNSKSLCDSSAVFYRMATCIIMCRVILFFNEMENIIFKWGLQIIY